MSNLSISLLDKVPQPVFSTYTPFFLSETLLKETDSDSSSLSSNIQHPLSFHLDSHDDSDTHHSNLSTSSKKIRKEELTKSKKVDQKVEKLQKESSSKSIQLKKHFKLEPFESRPFFSEEPLLFEESQDEEQANEGTTASSSDEKSHSDKQTDLPAGILIEEESIEADASSLYFLKPEQGNCGAESSLNHLRGENILIPAETIEENDDFVILDGEDEEVEVTSSNKQGKKEQLMMAMETEIDFACDDGPICVGGDKREEDRRNTLQDPRKRLPSSNVLVPLMSTLALRDPRGMPPKASETQEKLNLVLDLDETILNSHTFSLDFDVATLKDIPSQWIKTIKEEDYMIVVVLHPSIPKFLKTVSKFYNIYVYSHGRHEYVQDILKMIDKDKKFIRRDHIFENHGQVTHSTPKLLTSLGLNPIEIKKTLIIDDQKHAWEEDHLCAKKFIPLKGYISEERYNKFMLFASEREENSQKRWLFHNEEGSDLEHYSEQSVLSPQQSHLEVLASFLEDVAQEFIKTRKMANNERNNLFLEDFYKSKLSSVLKGLKVSVLSESKSREKMFGELVEILGGTLEEARKAHYLLIDENLGIFQEDLVEELLEEKPLMTVASVFWLLECFFCFKRVSLLRFQKN